MENLIKRNTCKGIVEYDIIPNKKEFDEGYKPIKFEIIDTTETSKEFIQKLAIIRGDIVEACIGTTNKCAVVLDFYRFDVHGAIKTIEKVMEEEGMKVSDVPIFFVFEKTSYDIFYTRVIGLMKKGYVNANALVNFENNFVMVKTIKYVLDSMYRHVYSKSL